MSHNGTFKGIRISVQYQVSVPISYDISTLAPRILSHIYSCIIIITLERLRKANAFCLIIDHLYVYRNKRRTNTLRGEATFIKTILFISGKEFTLKAKNFLPLAHCKHFRKLYGKIPGNQLPSHVPLFFSDASRLF